MERQGPQASPVARMRLVLPALVLGVCCCIGAWGMARGKGQAPEHIVVQNYYYALPDKSDEVYAWRLHASEARAKLGLRRGRVLRRIPASQPESGFVLPDVIWECDYPSDAARQEEIKRLADSQEFDQVERHMETLIRGFRRVMFQSSS